MGKWSLCESGHYGEIDNIGEIMGTGQLGKEKQQQQQQQQTPGRVAENVCRSGFECVSSLYTKPMCIHLRVANAWVRI